MTSFRFQRARLRFPDGDVVVVRPAIAAANRAYAEALIRNFEPYRVGFSARVRGGIDEAFSDGRALDVLARTLAEGVVDSVDRADGTDVDGPDAVREYLLADPDRLEEVLELASRPDVFEGSHPDAARA